LIIRLTINLLLILNLLCPQAHAGDITNLISAWLLNESSGTRFDETSNNNDLTDNNTVGFNASCEFDGCGDFEDTNTEFLSITDASQTGLDITGDMTICGFANFESLGSTAALEVRLLFLVKMMQVLIEPIFYLKEVLIQLHLQ